MNASEIFFCLLAVMLIVGYFYNIVKLFFYGEGGLSKAIRIMGIVFPIIGAIYGWWGKDARLRRSVDTY